MQTVSWSTTDVEPRWRFEYWNDLLGKALGGVNVAQPSRHDFDATIFARRLQDATFTSFSFSGSRDRAHIEEYIPRPKRCLSVEPTALWDRAAETGSRASVLRPGELSMVDPRQPFSVTLSGDVRRMVASLPRRMVHRYAPIWRDPNTLNIRETEPSVDLIREYVLRLADPAFRVDDTVAEVLGENLCALVGVVVGRGVDSLTEAHPQLDLRLEALLAYMRRNCSDPDLGPAVAAAHLRISVRTVHKLMEPTGRTFGEWLLDERLLRCVRMLEDTTHARRKISDIAWTCGFNDLSHFNKMFRSRLGATPSDLRRETTQARLHPVGPEPHST